MRVKNPLRDLSFYAALVPLIFALAPREARVWVEQNPEAVAPLLMWMATHGWLRGRAMSMTVENSKKVD